MKILIETDEAMRDFYPVLQHFRLLYLARIAGRQNKRL